MKYFEFVLDMLVPLQFSKECVDDAPHRVVNERSSTNDFTRTHYSIYL